MRRGFVHSNHWFPNGSLFGMVWDGYTMYEYTRADWIGNPPAESFDDPRPPERYPVAFQPYTRYDPRTGQFVNCAGSITPLWIAPAITSQLPGVAPASPQPTTMAPMVPAQPARPRRRYFLRARPGARMGMMPMALTAATDVYVSRHQAGVMTASLPEDAPLPLSPALELIPARRYEPLPVSLSQVLRPLAAHPFSMRDVLDQIRAPDAWRESRGAGVHIAIVDTGICGTLPDFPAGKQSPHSRAYDCKPWTDEVGHGSMTGGIAAASTAGGGRYDGVAPDATLISCRTTFDDTELFELYEHLLDLVEFGTIGRLVVNNSYGFYTCASPGVRVDDPFPSIIRLAVQAGIVVVFAAGNNHVVVCQKDAAACEPNTIWATNSLDEVITVGTVNRDGLMDQPPGVAGDYSHRDSSRGPGELAAQRTKPDFVAPTYGEVIWGCGYQSMEWWGTSGAAPQVAGLAALILGKNPSLSPAEVRGIIESTCRPLELGRSCAGAGMIDCAAALAETPAPES